MKTKRYILVLTALMTVAFYSYSQSGSRSLMSTRAIGHMCVEIVSTAAVTHIEATAISAESMNQDGSISVASVTLAGNTVTYAVTVPEGTVQFHSNNKNLIASNFIATTNLNNNDLNIAATLRVNDTNKELIAVIPSSPLVIAINYN
jgi:hypothetical protein